MRTIVLLAFGLTVVAGPAFAHHPKHSPQGEAKAFGHASDPRKAQRTIHIEMSDKMRYAPAEIEVSQNERLRFVVRNAGKQMHEMVLGSMEDLKEHAELMRKHGGMKHDDAGMMHVAPGKTGEFGWQFTKPGTFYFGCLIPGHFEAGMIGTITVRP